ncbi:hypothetical protein HMSP1_79 [Sinorhizobium phage HMSP1-Susan]|nr:hypothetical protein HMSP1_79 [Sinorhizobium phage HMSP1-Susan]
MNWREIPAGVGSACTVIEIGNARSVPENNYPEGFTNLPQCSISKSR